MRKKFKAIVLFILLMVSASIVGCGKEDEFRTLQASIEEYEVTVEGEIPDDVTMSVSMPSEGIFDITLENRGGKEWQPCDYGKSVEVKISGSKPFSGVITHYYADGTEEIISADTQGESVSFSTGHFSEFEATEKISYAENSAKFELLTSPISATSNVYYYMEPDTNIVWLYTDGTGVLTSGDGGLSSGIWENPFGNSIGSPTTLKTISQVLMTSDSSVLKLDGKCNKLFQNFSGCTYFDCSEWDTSSVIEMKYMFNNCANLIILDISNWNTSNITDMSNIFNGCSSLKKIKIPNITCSSKNSFIPNKWVNENDYTTEVSSLLCGTESISAGTYKRVIKANIITDGATNTYYSDYNDVLTYIPEEREGYEHKLYTNSSMTTPYDMSTVLTADKTLYGRYEALSYTVTFNTNGGSEIAQQTISGGNAATRPEDPTREYCALEGWYTDEELTVPYDFSAPVTEDITLYAKWVDADGCFTYKNNKDLFKLVPEETDTYYYIDPENVLWLYGDNSSLSGLAKPLYEKDKIDLTSIIEIRFTNDCNIINLTTGEQLFCYIKSLVPYAFTNCVNIDTVCFNTSNVTDMSHMFYNCQKIKTLDLTTFDTSKVTSMGSMFAKCYSLTNLNLSTIDTSLVESMTFLFSECYQLKKIDISTFNTPNLRSCASMFSSCRSLEDINLGNLNLTKIISLYGMFGECYSLEDVDLSMMDTSNIQETSFMFAGCYKLKKIKGIENINMSNAKYMRFMFAGCESLSELDLSRWDLSNAVEMDYMFANYIVYNEEDEPIRLTENNYTVLKLPEITCTVRDHITGIVTDLEEFNRNEETIKQTTWANEQGEDCSTLLVGTETVPAGTYYRKISVTTIVENVNKKTLIDWNAAFNEIPTSSTGSQFIGWCTDERLTQLYDVTTVLTNDITLFAKFEDSKPGFTYKNNKSLFKLIPDEIDTYYYIDLDNVLWLYGDNSSLSAVSAPLMEVDNIDISQIKEVRYTDDCGIINVQSGEFLFAYMSRCTNIALNKLNTSNVENFDFMFAYNLALKQIDASYLDVSNATSLEGVFLYNRNLKTLDVSGWNTAKVEYMGNIFMGCDSLISIDVLNWDVSNVLEMPCLFAGCSSLTQIDISTWDIKEDTDLSGMFTGYAYFDREAVESTFEPLPNDNLQTLKLPEITSLERSMFVSNIDEDATYEDTNWNPTAWYNEDNVNCSILMNTTEQPIPAGTYTRGLMHNIACISSETGDYETVGYGFSKKASPLDINSVILELEYCSIDKLYLDEEKTIEYNGSNLTHDTVFYADIKEEFTYKNNTDLEWKLFPDSTNVYYYVDEDDVLWFYGDKETLNSELVSIPKIKQVTESMHRYINPLYEIADIENIKEIKNTADCGIIPVKDANYLFAEYKSCENIEVDHFDFSNCVKFEYMFSRCETIKSIDLSTMNTKGATSTEGMFSFCSSLEFLDLSNWDFTNNERVSYMFFGCTNLKEIIGIQSMVTSKTDGITCVFGDCNSLEELDISNWDTSNIYSFAGVFAGCHSLKNIDVSHFNTSAATAFMIMFANCYSLEEIDISNFVITDDDEIDCLFAQGLDIISFLDTGKSVTENAKIYPINIDNTVSYKLNTIILPDIPASTATYDPEYTDITGRNSVVNENNWANINDLSTNKYDLLVSKNAIPAGTYRRVVQASFETGIANEDGTFYTPYREPLTLPELSEQKYYNFDGWFTDAEFNNEFDETAPVVEDITLYAKYTLKPRDYMITIPKKLVMDGESKSVGYNISVGGLIYEGESIRIKPATDTFILSQEGKEDVVATITQMDNKFSNDTVENTASTIGTITAEGLSAGVWNGTFQFSVELRNGPDSGVYDASGNMVASWEELINTYGLDVESNYAMYSYAPNYYGTAESSLCSVLTNNANLNTITKIVIDENVTSLGAYSLADCKNLTSIILPPDLSRISSGLLGLCSNLMTIEIPETVTVIADNAFNGCTGLHSINIPKEVTDIKAQAFQGCTGLININIPNTVVSIGSDVFKGCSNLETINYQGTEEQWNTIKFGTNWNSGCPADMQINYNYSYE